MKSTNRKSVKKRKRNQKLLKKNCVKLKESKRGT